MQSEVRVGEERQRGLHLEFALEIVAHLHLHTHRESESVLVGWSCYLKSVAFVIDTTCCFPPALNTQIQHTNVDFKQHENLHTSSRESTPRADSVSAGIQALTDDSRKAFTAS